MQFAMAFKIIGVLLILFSTAMLPSLFLSLACLLYTSDAADE